MQDKSDNEAPRTLIAFARLFAAIIWLIALPGWGIERLVRRFWKPDWYFDLSTATLYFLVAALGSAVGVIWGSIPVATIGLYPPTAMEMYALWYCVTIAMGRPGMAYSLMKKYGKRPNIKQEAPLFSKSTLYIAGVSYCYTIFYFGVLNYFLFRMIECAFQGIQGQSPLARAWEFFYYSTVTIMTLGYGDIVPKHFLSQFLTVVELFIGLFFALFVFGAFVSFYVDRNGERVKKL